MQLLDDVLDADAAHADAGAHWINVVLQRGHGDLGAMASLAGDVLDFHLPIVDLGDFIFQQPPQHIAMPPTDDNLRAAAAPLDFHDIDADLLMGAVTFTRNLLRANQISFRAS